MTYESETMHDLNTIIRRNAEAHGQAIHDARAKGNHVVALYDGLHLVSHREFAESDGAIRYAEEARQERVPGRSIYLLTPLKDAA